MCSSDLIRHAFAEVFGPLTDDVVCYHNAKESDAHNGSEKDEVHVCISDSPLIIQGKSKLK